ncbi:MAG: MerR family transcriptional regulator [Elusimicrobia bacterium]|nr:MerR family transcriptional regulator [Elusimicrobiota bacterium]
MLSNLPDKDFFTMGEVSGLAGVTPHTLRYWESRLGAPKPSRLPSGHRRYTRADLETILWVKELLESRKFTFAGARRALLDRKRGRAASATGSGEGDAVPAKMMKTLLEVKRELRSMIAELSR